MENKKKSKYRIISPTSPEDVCGSGSLKFKTTSSNYIYSKEKSRIINDAIYKWNYIRNNEVKNYLHAIVGVISTLLDRRESAKIYRKKRKENMDGIVLSKDETYMYYNVPTNIWMFHPSLAHMMYGAGRYAFFVLINDIGDILLKNIDIEHTIESIYESEYEYLLTVWEQLKLNIYNFKDTSPDNPFQKLLLNTLDFIFEKGVGCLGANFYQNWWISRKRRNFQGHLCDLDSWENSVKNGKVFDTKNPFSKEWKKVCNNEIQ